MVRSFDEERICDIYLSRINYWRNINKNNHKCAQIKSRKLKILKRQLVNLQVKSLEEENCILKPNIECVHSTLYELCASTCRLAELKEAKQRQGHKQTIIKTPY